MAIEYDTITTPSQPGRSLATVMTEAAAEGWRYVDTLKASYWGSDQRLVAVVLMQREVP